jgi:hypothetical protein
VGRRACLARLVYGIRFKGLGVALAESDAQIIESDTLTRFCPSLAGNQGRQAHAWEAKSMGPANRDQPIARTLEITMCFLDLQHGLSENRESGKERRDSGGAAASR